MKKDELKNYWQTPNDILVSVAEVLGINYFDPCPINPVFDGLCESFSWQEKCFINPPYSRGMLEKWSAKALKEFKENSEYIWLINYGATFNRKIIKQKATAICDLYARVSFLNPSTGEPRRSNDRDSVLYYWGYQPDLFAKKFERWGVIFKKRYTGT